MRQREISREKVLKKLQRGQTQGKVAEDLGCDQGTVSKIWNSSIDKHTSRSEVYTLAKNSFTLVGKGEKGEHCGGQKLNWFDPDKENLKNLLCFCEDPECPECYETWSRIRTFQIVLKLEIEAKIRGSRPFLGVLSVRPSDARNWTWEQLSKKLFRKGYDELRDCNVDTGTAIFHPYRIKKEKEKGLRKNGYADKESVEKAGLWSGIREDGLDLGNWRKYVKYGPHAHFLGFGNPKAHEDEDLFLEFKDNNKGEVEKKSTLELIRYVGYVLSHTGQYKYKNTKTSRVFGSMRGNISEEISDKWLKEKRKEIARLMGLKWTKERGLMLQTDKPEVDKKSDWLPLWEIAYKKEHWRDLTRSTKELYEDIKYCVENEPESLYWKNFKRLRLSEEEIDNGVSPLPDQWTLVNEISPQKATKREKQQNFEKEGS